MTPNKRMKHRLLKLFLERAMKKLCAKHDLESIPNTFPQGSLYVSSVFELSIVMGFPKAQLQSTDLHEKCHLK